MASKRDRIQQKARERKRNRDKERLKAAAKRREHNASLSQASMDQVLSWSEGECYLSQDWHEQGAHIWAIFTRRHPSGRCAAAMFELDLAEEGVQEVELLLGVAEDQLMMRLANLSQKHPLVVTGGEMVVHAVRTAESWSKAQEYELPEGFAEAVRLFGDFKLPPGMPDFKVGREAGDAKRLQPPVEPQAEGIWGRVKKRLGF